MRGKATVGAGIAAFLFIAGSALAHPGPGISGEHTSFEHFAAMLAVGLWVVILGGGAAYFAARLSTRLARKAQRPKLK